MKDPNPAKLFLLPNRFKIVGGILLFIGIVLGVIRFYFGLKPDYLKISVLSVYSAFLETKYFSVITNNISEEIVGLLVLIGLFMIAFSKEKDENDNVQMIRLSSMYLSVFINTLLLALSFFFVYGIAFAEMMALNLYSVLIIFIITFKVQLYPYLQKNP